MTSGDPGGSLLPPPSFGRDLTHGDAAHQDDPAVVLKVPHSIENSSDVTFSGTHGALRRSPPTVRRRNCGSAMRLPRKPALHTQPDREGFPTRANRATTERSVPRPMTGHVGSSQDHVEACLSSPPQAKSRYRVNSDTRSATSASNARCIGDVVRGGCIY